MIGGGTLEVRGGDVQLGRTEHIRNVSPPQLAKRPQASGAGYSPDTKAR